MKFKINYFFVAFLLVACGDVETKDKNEKNACQKTLDCAKDEVCDKGFCRELNQCVNALDCRPDERCVEELCREPTHCVNALDCGVGELCVDEICTK